MNNSITLLCIGLFCLANTFQVLGQSSLFSYETYVNNDGDSLKYRQLISDYDPVSKYPLVIFLHGAGERGNDNEAQLKWGIMNFTSEQIMHVHRPIVIAPQCPKNMRWADYSAKTTTFQSAPTSPMKLLLELIDQAVSTLPVDTNRIYITGLSMGGFGTFDAISRQPDRFAAAVPVCGGGDVSLAPSIAHLPIWIFHGALDSVVKPELAQNMYAALIKAGANPGLTIYPDIGHFSWLGAYSDTKMMNWLFQQKK